MDLQEVKLDYFTEGRYCQELRPRPLAGNHKNSRQIKFVTLMGLLALPSTLSGCRLANFVFLVRGENGIIVIP
jgi:hypothetical protein